MPPSDLIHALEERLVNVWPAVETLLMEGWAIRFANGYTGRANSASAVVQGATMTPELLDEIERLYRAAGLTPCVRVTSVCDAAVGPLLDSHGWRVKDHSKVMLLDLAAWRGRTPDPRVRLDHHATRVWAEGVGSVQAPEKRNADHLLAIVSRIRVPAAFAALMHDGRAAGFGMGAVDRGYAEIGSVVVDAAIRGKGLGRLTMEALLVWAAGQGASHAFLQVDATNGVAINLYDSLGFKEVGTYRTMLAPALTASARTPGPSRLRWPG